MNIGSVEEAQKLFKKELEELGVDDIELLSYDDEQRKSVAEYIKNQWETNLPGLEITINQQSNKQKLALEDKQDYDISHSCWRNEIRDPVDFLTVLLSAGSYNWQDFKNEEYDELVNEAQTNFSDNEKRFSNLQEAERILIGEEAAISPMYIAGSVKLIEPYVHNYIEHSDDTYSYKGLNLINN